jgi:uncharacterized membrane protein YcaP (DUF421 family)
MGAVDWGGLGRVALFATCGYVVLLGLIRLVGPRTISKMNPSDFAITVALGSLVANLTLSKDVTLIEGLAALTVLVGLQLATESLSTRWRRFRAAAEGSPILLFYEGQFLPGAMRRHHVTETAVYQAIRENGVSDIEDVHAVILEIDGAFSIITGGRRRTESALDDVQRQ